MSTDHWQRLNDLFHDALRLQGDERAAYIASACAGDDVLRAELEQLIEADEHAGRFLGVNAFEDLAAAAGGQPADAPGAGRRFGAYRVVAELGRGGMGAVFLANRDDGHFEQQVAIKVIKRGMDTAMVLERFRVERQILSTLGMLRRSGTSPKARFGSPTSSPKRETSARPSLTPAARVVCTSRLRRPPRGAPPRRS